MFMECGWPAWLVLLLGLIALGLALVALVLALLATKHARLLSVLAVAAALLPAGAGALGTLWGQHQVDAVLTAVDPAQRERIREVGYREAAQCTTLGAEGASLPLALAVAGLLVSVLRRERSS